MTMSKEFDVYAFYNHGPMYGIPYGSRDHYAEKIFQQFDGRQIGKGTLIETGERDIQYRFTDESKANDCNKALIEAGFRSSMEQVRTQGEA